MNGQVFRPSNEQDATRDERGEVCPRNKPNLSGRNINEIKEGEI